MRKQKLYTVLLIVIWGGIVCFSSCEKAIDNPIVVPTSRLELYLTDSPGEYQAVWIDIQKIWVDTLGSIPDSDPGWKEITLNHSGRYNLLDFRNGEDTVLAATDLPAGRISQIKLMLGDDNALTLEDGTTMPLTISAEVQSGLILPVNVDLAAGTPYALVLDFDAARSIEKDSSGQYWLEPVIRTFTKDAGGSIKGVVLPDTASAYVMAIMDTDTLGAIPDDSGHYAFSGVPAGTYQLFFAVDHGPTDFYTDTLKDIQVTAGQVTIADTLWLHP